MAASSNSLLKPVSPIDIFNLPLYEHYLVIDTRPLEEYERGHIATAVSYPHHTTSSPSCSEEEREASLVAFARDYSAQFYRPENPNPLVLYGDRAENELRHTQWLADKLTLLKNQRSRVSVYSPQVSSTREKEAKESEETFDPFEEFCLTVIDKVKEIWILDCTYDSFASEYPFLCGHVRFEEMFPLPHQITRNVFMGSRVVPMSGHALSKMGISHVIISEHQDIDMEELKNVHVLKCPVKDKNDENMLPCWEASCSFIDKAVSENGRVLAFVHGRSRSASVILAYLMKTLEMNFESSWTHLRSKCWHLIDKSLVFEEQLHQWYRELHCLTLTEF